MNETKTPEQKQSEAVDAVETGIRLRLRWASTHWGTEAVSEDAWQQLALAALHGLRDAGYKIVKVSEE